MTGPSLSTAELDALSRRPTYEPVDDPPWPDELAIGARPRVVPRPSNVADRDLSHGPTRPDFLSVATMTEPTDLEAWLVDGCIRPNSLSTWAAPEGSAKSQLRCELAIRASTATGAFLGHHAIPRPVRVMTLDEENGPSEEYRREDAILAALDLDRAALTHYFRASFAGMVLTDREAQRWLDAQVEAIAPDLLILDTATAMLGDEWGTELKAGVRYLRSLIGRYSCAIVCLVHMTKPARDRRPGDPAHGSALSHVMGQWGRPADAVALIADLGDDRLRWSMRKRVPPTDLILRKAAGIFEVVAVGDGARKPTADDRVLRAIAAGAGSADELQGALGLARSTILAAVSRLRADGLVDPGTPYRLSDDGMEAVQ